MNLFHGVGELKEIYMGRRAGGQGKEWSEILPRYTTRATSRKKY
jgi:hypothetical protein